ncbi:hypothetical protein [Amycolatopsis sulphurea]|uniref:hypothetical protein n=1 Tax=Amycolatopsis sulphurea TaxID=76022 RepID=UPI001145ACC6|nr:hypothetical protein [Amycolatopsis sulphurea]
MNTNGKTSEETVAAAHLRWLWGWDRNPGDPQFDLRAVQGEFYDWQDEDLLLYDDADPQHRVARSAEEYRSMWEPSSTGWQRPTTGSRTARTRWSPGTSPSRG